MPLDKVSDREKHQCPSWVVWSCSELVDTYLAGTKFIYYVWLNAYDPEKYPAEVVEGPAYIALYGSCYYYAQPKLITVSDHFT